MDEILIIPLTTRCFRFFFFFRTINTCSGNFDRISIFRYLIFQWINKNVAFVQIFIGYFIGVFCKISYNFFQYISRIYVLNISTSCLGDLRQKIEQIFQFNISKRSIFSLYLTQESPYILYLDIAQLTHRTKYIQ